jgi:uncharacterized OsmC-like protein
MITSRVHYLGGLRTKAQHIKSGKEIITDAPVDNQGKGEAFSPTDLIATALASCMMTIMGIKARDKQIDIEGAEACVEKIMASEPRRVSNVIIKVQMPNKKYSPEEKEILLEAAKGCPVCRSVHPETKVDLDIIWAN